jgi:plastocyanin
MIMIKDFAYRTPTSVSPGARVEVMNGDGEAHTVTSDSKGDFDVTVAAGASVTITAPTKPGSYAFHCNFHSNMHGVLVVK